MKKAPYGAFLLRSLGLLASAGQIAKSILTTRSCPSANCACKPPIRLLLFIKNGGLLNFLYLFNFGEELPNSARDPTVQGGH